MNKEYKETIGLTGTNNEELIKIISERTYQGFSIAKSKKMILDKNTIFYSYTLIRNN